MANDDLRRGSGPGPGAAGRRRTDRLDRRRLLGERFHRAVDEAGTEIVPPPREEDEASPEPALTKED